MQGIHVADTSITHRRVEVRLGTNVIPASRDTPRDTIATNQQSAATAAVSSSSRSTNRQTDRLTDCPTQTDHACSLSSDRQHLSYDVRLEVRGEIIRTVLFCTVY